MHQKGVRLNCSRRWIVMASLRKILKWTAGLVLAAVLAVIAINAYDPPLSDDAKSMSQSPPNPYPPEKNLYVAMRGFLAPPGESVIVAGTQRIAEDDRLAALYVDHPRAATQQSPPVDKNASNFRGKVPECDAVFTSCWKSAPANAAVIRQLGEDNRELVKRYLDLHRFEVYFEGVQPSVGMRSAQVPVGVRNLFLARTALDVQSPSGRAAALADLHADLRIWRTVLKGESTLVSRMIALAYLHGDLLLLGDMLADRRIDWTPHEREIDAMLSTMQAQDWFIGGMAKSEFRLARATISPLARGVREVRKGEEGTVADWFRAALAKVPMHFFQPNATLNASAENFVRLERLADTESPAYLAALALHEKWVEAQARPGFSWLYNPIGHVMVGVGVPAYAGYSGRARDTEALHRMVRLTHEIRKARVADDGIPAFMMAHPEWSIHPTSAKRFEWDAQARRLMVPRIVEPNRTRRFDISFAA
jgi:hypothetical protein